MHTLTNYIIAVLVVMVVINVLVYFYMPAKSRDVLFHCVSFLFGMLAMYIAVHVYVWQ